MPAEATVVLARCQSYEPHEVAEAVGRVLAALEPLPLPTAGRILLKPNGLSPDHGPEVPVNTRAEVVEAVGRYLAEPRGDGKERPELIIADSSGAGRYSRSEQTYKRMGYDRVANDLGCHTVNMERMGLTELKSPTNLILPSFQASELLNSVDAIVNLPKLKTHMLTGLTGAVKNCLGLLPGSLKRAVHIAAPSGENMSLALVDIFAALRPALHIMDAVVVMEGQGPSTGQPRLAGWIIGSTDAVALDAVAAKITGFEPREVVTVAAAADAGLGQADPDKIRLVGADWEELTLPDFKLPFSAVRRFIDRIRTGPKQSINGPVDLVANILPHGFLTWAIEYIQEGKPRLIPENCKLCGLCVESCPAGALTIENKALHMDKDKCIECYCCLEHCAEGGLWVPQGLWQKLRDKPPDSAVLKKPSVDKSGQAG